MSSTVTPTSFFSLPPVLESTVDVILKSSDGVQFRAHKSLLAAASTAFESTFMLPQKSRPTEAEELPVVELADSGLVLGTLLAYIYPATRKRPETLNLLRDTLAAASKYDIETVIDSMRPHLMWPQFVHTSALTVYDVCYSMKFQQEKDIVLMETYGIDEDSLLQSARHLGFDLVELLENRRARARKIMKLIQDVMNNRYRHEHIPWCAACRKMPPYTTIWLRYSEAELSKRPTTDKVFSMAFLEEILAGSPRCYCVAMASQWGAVGFNSFKRLVDEGLK